ncbi:MAG: phage tail tape measure protein [Gammaproteobacteria bacterium]|nr:phage tail tape measure protein [Gammaproteobacteria bacterium]
MAEPTANLRVRIGADFNDIKQSLVLLRKDLNEVRNTAGRPLPTNNAINQLGVSAGQTAQAMRQLPAQFTDVFTSLQGGMPWFTVLVQQGGQIKDSFGGVGPALRGVGQGIAGLMTPTAAYAAIVGVLAYAWYDAARSSEAYTRSLVLSRNEAAATSAVLADLSARTASSQDVSVGKAQAAAVAIGQSGQVARENFDAVARAAVAMEEINGAAIDDTVAAYAKLAGDPVKYSQELNKQVNFLTVEIYDQIRALQEQGRNQEAATVATRAAADATAEALAKVRGSQNWVGRGWDELWVKASKAWSAFQGAIGLGSTAQEMQKLLQDNQRDVAIMNKGVADGMGYAWVYQYESAIKSRSARIKEIAAQQQKEAKDAQVTAAQSTSQEVAQELDAIIDAQASKEEKKRREVARVQVAAQEAIEKAKAAGLSDVVTELEERRQKAIAAIQEKYAKKNTGGTGSATRGAGLQAFKDDLVEEQAEIAASTQTLRAQYAARELTAEQYYGNMRELLTRGAAAEAKALQGQIDYLQQQTVAGKDAIGVGRQIGELEARLAKVRTEGAAKLEVLASEERAAAASRANAIASYANALDASNDALERQMRAMVAKVGMGDREYEVQQRINDAYADQADKLRELQLQLNAKQIDQGMFDSEKAVLLEKTGDRIEAIRAGYADLATAEGNWLSGATAAWSNYAQQAGDVAGQMRDVVGNVFSGWEDKFAQFTTSGKMSFSDLADSIIKDLARIAAKQAVTGLVNLVSSAFGAAYGGGVNTAGNAAVTNGTQGINQDLFNKLMAGGKSEGGYTGPGDKYEPKGIVHAGEVVWSQADVARAGGVGIVEAMRQGFRGYAEGGVVGGLSSPAIGGGGVNVTVRNAPAGTTASASKNDKGGVDIDVLLGQVDSYIGGQVASGQGSTYAAMGSRFGLKDSV